MKKLLIAIIPSLILMCFVLTMTPTKAFTDERGYWLYGFVDSSGYSVGPGKRVYIYDSPDHYIGYTETKSGNENGWYKWTFYDPLYVYKVRCAFYVGNQYYSGETIIDRTLHGDTRVDITVYPGGAPPDK